MVSFNPYTPAASGGGAGWQSNLLLPAGAIAETFPRILAGTNFALTSGSSVIGAIPLPAGATVSNITVICSAPETGGTHGWVALLDKTGKVLGVSADQGATWISPINTAVTTPLAAPVQITTAGTYYIAMAVTATGPPTVIAQNSTTSSVATGQSPTLGGNAGISAGPPAVGTTLTLNSNQNNLYAYVS